MTQYATGSQHCHTVTATARYRPQWQDTGATVTKTGMSRWNRDGNRNAERWPLADRKNLLPQKNLPSLIPRGRPPAMFGQAAGHDEDSDVYGMANLIHT
jgi:hypothetical protein